MESVASNENFETDDPTNERQQRMLARLNARHLQREAVTTKPVSSTEQDFNELQMEAMALINSPERSIEPEFLQKLETALAVLPTGHQSRRLKDALITLRNRMQEEKAGLTNEKEQFTFSNSDNAHVSQATNIHKTVPAHPGLQNTLSKTEAAKIQFEKLADVNDKHGEEMVINGEDGDEVVINNISKCEIRVPFKASTVHIKSAIDSTLIFAPVKTSLLIRNCEKLTIAVAAQQIRIHDSHQMRLHIEVRGALIIENCDGVEVAPYNVVGFERNPENDNWRKVQDFNWLSTDEQSPNWKIMTENSDRCFSL